MGFTLPPKSYGNRKTGSRHLSPSFEGHLLVPNQCNPEKPYMSPWRSKHFPKGPKAPEQGPGLSGSLFACHLHSAVPLPFCPGLSLAKKPATDFSFGQSTRKPKPWQDVGLRPERWRELQSPPPPGCRPRELLREPLVIPIAPTCHPPSKSPNADLPALVMIISVPASWNFFQSSFSCRPTLMFSMV